MNASEFAQIQELVSKAPHLLSPALLMAKYRRGKWRIAPHLKMIDDLLMGTLHQEGLRMMLNMPSGHGKSELVTRAYIAWRLIWEPHLRVIIVGHGEEFAIAEFGAVIKDIVEQYGAVRGIKIRSDMKSKGNWKIEKYGGGVECFGPESGVVGHHAEIFCIDDPIRTPQQAMSEAVMDAHWEFYKGTVYGRLRNQTSLIMIGTRWSRKDLFGRVMAMERETGEWARWTHWKFTAIAKEGDILGRKPGEALWPEVYSQQKIEAAKRSFGAFFEAAYQQNPSSEEHALLRPNDWPTWLDMGHAYMLCDGPSMRTQIPIGNVTTVITVDWASSEKKSADRTAMLVGGILPDGRLLIFRSVTGRFSIERAIHELAKLCREVHPSIVACEAYAFQASMANECRRHAEIPEIMRMTPDYKANAKVRRAYPAVIMGQNRRIFLPDDSEPWLDDLKSELAAFTGVNDDSDDQVDSLGYLAQLAQTLRGPGTYAADPEVLMQPPNHYPSAPYMGGM